MNFVITPVSVAAAITVLASPAVAGGMSEPVMEAEPMMEPEVVVEGSSGSSDGFVIPLMLLALLAAIASNSGSDTDTAVIE